MSQDFATYSCGVSSKIFAAEDRHAPPTQDVDLASRDRILFDTIAESVDHQSTAGVDLFRAHILDAHETFCTNCQLCDDVRIDLKDCATVVTGPHGSSNQSADMPHGIDRAHERISGQLKELFKTLSSISHDLQTPITRMRLRVERLGESMEQRKLVDDLREIEHLVREGVSYARGTLSGPKVPAIIDPVAFLESLVADYEDMGRPVTLFAPIGGQIKSCPQTLRRVLSNLIDNAIKYGGAAEVSVHRDEGNALCVAVSDRGPGIPESELQEVLRPFYRRAVSRNSDISGAGLGLAIAAQLISSMGGTLVLSNRSDGGLTATITLP